MSRILLLSLAMVLLTACAGRDTAPDTDPADERGVRADDRRDTTRAADRDRRGVGEMEALEPDPADDPLLGNMVVYFDFDRDEVKSEHRDMLRAHAQFLSNNPRARVRLEGHTDERGSREYNVGLGERRALSVRRYMLLQGVSSDQITTVSYGEERPAASGSNEQAWSQNRRVELVYRQ